MYDNELIRFVLMKCYLTSVVKMLAFNDTDKLHSPFASSAPHPSPDRAHKPRSSVKPCSLRQISCFLCLNSLNITCNCNPHLLQHVRVSPALQQNNSDHRVRRNLSPGRYVPPRVIMHTRALTLRCFHIQLNISHVVEYCNH